LLAHEELTDFFPDIELRMKKKYNTLELATGFLMGSFPAFVIETAILYAYNFLCKWSGCGLFEADWWMFVPFPLVIGIFMAVAIASLHLEDY